MNGITLDVKQIKIFERDSSIQMDVKMPKSRFFNGKETDEQKQLQEMLRALDWKIKGTHYPEGEPHGITTIEHAQYPNRYIVKANCEERCKGMKVSFGDPQHTIIQGRLLVPAVIMESKEFMQCIIGKDTIECRIPTTNLHQRMFTG